MNFMIDVIKFNIELTETYLHLALIHFVPIILYFHNFGNPFYFFNFRIFSSLKF